MLEKQFRGCSNFPQRYALLQLLQSMALAVVKYDYSCSLLN